MLQIKIKETLTFFIIYLLKISNSIIIFKISKEDGENTVPSVAGSKRKRRGDCSPESSFRFEHNKQEFGRNRGMGKETGTFG